MSERKDKRLILLGQRRSYGSDIAKELGPKVSCPQPPSFHTSTNGQNEEREEEENPWDDKNWNGSRSGSWSGSRGGSRRGSPRTNREKERDTEPSPNTEESPSVSFSDLSSTFSPALLPSLPPSHSFIAPLSSEVEEERELLEKPSREKEGQEKHPEEQEVIQEQREQHQEEKLPSKDERRQIVEKMKEVGTSEWKANPSGNSTEKTFIGKRRASVGGVEGVVLQERRLIFQMEGEARVEEGDDGEGEEEVKWAVGSTLVSRKRAHTSERKKTVHQQILPQVHHSINHPPPFDLAEHQRKTIQSLSLSTSISSSDSLSSFAAHSSCLSTSPSTSPFSTPPHSPPSPPGPRLPSPSHAPEPEPAPAHPLSPLSPFSSPLSPFSTPLSPFTSPNAPSLSSPPPTSPVTPLSPSPLPKILKMKGLLPKFFEEREGGRVEGGKWETGKGEGGGRKEWEEGREGGRGETDRERETFKLGERREREGKERDEKEKQRDEKEKERDMKESQRDEEERERDERERERDEKEKKRDERERERDERDKERFTRKELYERKEERECRLREREEREQARDERERGREEREKERQERAKERQGREKEREKREKREKRRSKGKKRKSLRERNSAVQPATPSPSFSLPPTEASKEKQLEGKEPKQDQQQPQPQQPQQHIEQTQEEGAQEREAEEIDPQIEQQPTPTSATSGYQLVQEGSSSYVVLNKKNRSSFQPDSYIWSSPKREYQYVGEQGEGNSGVVYQVMSEGKVYALKNIFLSSRQRLAGWGRESGGGERGKEREKERGGREGGRDGGNGGWREGRGGGREEINKKMREGNVYGKLPRCPVLLSLEDHFIHSDGGSGEGKVPWSPAIPVDEEETPQSPTRPFLHPHPRCRGGTTVCLVTDFVHGSSIQQILEDGGVTDELIEQTILQNGVPDLSFRQFRQSPERARPIWMVEIFKQLFLGLSSLHEVQLVHGDVKPDNLLFGVSASAERELPFPALFLCDYGQVSEEGEVETILPPRGWIAPERQLGAKASASGDVYSAGLCMLAILTGTTSFSENHQRRQEKIHSLVLSGEIMFLVQHCLSVDPKGRPSSKRCYELLVSLQKTWLSLFSLQG